jgi:hypothetical protein
MSIRRKNSTMFGIKLIQIANWGIKIIDYCYTKFKLLPNLPRKVRRLPFTYFSETSWNQNVQITMPCENRITLLRIQA